MRLFTGASFELRASAKAENFLKFPTGGTRSAATVKEKPRSHPCSQWAYVVPGAERVLLIIVGRLTFF